MSATRGFGRDSSCCSPNTVPFRGERRPCAKHAPPAPISVTVASQGTMVNLWQLWNNMVMHSISCGCSLKWRTRAVKQQICLGVGGMRSAPMRGPGTQRSRLWMVLLIHGPGVLAMGALSPASGCRCRWRPKQLGCNCFSGAVLTQLQSAWRNGAAPWAKSGCARRYTSWHDSGAP